MYYHKTYKSWQFLLREFFNTDIKEFSKLEAKKSKLEEIQNQAYKTFWLPIGGTQVPTMA